MNPTFRRTALLPSFFLFVASLSCAWADNNSSSDAKRIKVLSDTTLSPLTDGPRIVDLGEKWKGDLGTGDFTVGLKLRAPERYTYDSGDLVSLWNGETRHGFNLSLTTNVGTSGQANRRQLQFGIDAASDLEWRQEGRPGNAILAFGLTVHRGELHVSTVESGENPTGKVYRYQEPGKWTSLGSPDGANAVSALATFGGELYAGTGKYRLGGSALAESENSTLGGKVYRYVSPDQWELVGQLPNTEAISSLAEYDGKLYATSLYRPAGFFRYEGGSEWTSLPVPEGHRVNALGVYGGGLFATSYDDGHVFRFDGKEWANLGVVDKDITQNYSFATWGDALHTSTWPTGKVYRWGGVDSWTDSGRLGEEKEVMAMLVHNGSFYAGTLPLAEVHRYEGNSRWQRLRQIDTTPDVQYRRVWTMATWQGRLFATTLPSGQIWSMTSGAMVTHDQELADGWHEVIARRQAGQLRLWVDGQLVASAEAGDLSLKTEGLQLQIGTGPRGRFHGEIQEVWIER